jgi:hypothetical protein
MKQERNGETKMRSRNWKPVPYTREEIEANAEYERVEALREEEDEAKMEILSWTAGNGSKIVVRFAHSGRGYDITVDGKWFEDCEISPVPAAQAAAAKAAGIVAKLGPVGLTAERKAMCERA